MKKLLLVIMATLLFMGANAQLLNENFSYTVGTLTSANGGANVGGGNWTNFSGTANNVSVEASSLSFTGYGSSGIDNKMKLISTSASAEDAYRSFTTQTTGTVYHAFLLNVADTARLLANSSTTGDYFVASLSSTSTTLFCMRLSIRKGSAGNTFQLGVRANSSAPAAVFSNTDLNPGTTYLIVASYSMISGANNDSVAVWIDPVISGTPPAPAISAVVTTGAEATDVARLAVRQGVNTPNCNIDGIRVGLTWTDALGAGGGPTPPAAVTSPAFTGTAFTTAKVSWSKPGSYNNATNTTLVFVKQGTAVTQGTPVISVSNYTASANFSAPLSTFQNDVAAKCMYTGDTNFVDITGLTQNTSYHVLIYTITDTDSLYSTAAVTNGSSLGPVAPTAVSALTFTATGQTSATVSWTKPGNYNNTNISTLVFLKQATAVTQGTPNIGETNYTANADFSLATSAYQNDAAAKCVYKGDTNFVDITGLTINTTYHVLVYTINSGDSLYSAAGIANGATQGAAAPPAALLSIGSSVPATSSVIYSQWKKGTYDPATSTIVVYLKKGSAITTGANTLNPSLIIADTAFNTGAGSIYPNDPAAKCIYKGDSTWADITGVDPASTYYATAFVIRDTDSSYSNSVSTTYYVPHAKPAKVISTAGTNITRTTALVTWTKPAGYINSTMTTLVFLKADSVIKPGTPTFSTTRYTASAIFKTGTKFQNDSAYCIYKGDTNFVNNISGLVNNHNYHIMICVVYDSDSVYSDTTAGQWLQYLPPPVAVNTVNWSAPSATSATISWTKDASYNNTVNTTLVFVKNGAINPGTPTSAVTKYTASTTMGSGTAYQHDAAAYCVYKGDASTVTVTGLNNTANYSVLVYVIEDIDSVYSAGAAGAGVTLPTPVRTDIGLINKVNPTTGVLDSTGKYVTVSGIVYGFNQRTAGTQFMIRDNTGGINVFHVSKSFGYAVKEGDSIITSGVLTTFRGLAEISNVDTIIRLDSNKTIHAPVVKVKPDESSESDLIRVENVRFVSTPVGTIWPAPGASGTSISLLNSNNDTVSLFLLPGSALVGQPLPSATNFTVTGMGSQFSTSTVSPYLFNGYRVIPRTAADVANFVPVPSDTLSAFNIISPVHQFVYNIQGNPATADITFNWSAAKPGIPAVTTNYTLQVDSVNGSFSPVLFSQPTLTDTFYKVNALTLMNTLGIQPGTSVIFKMRIKAAATPFAYSRLSDSVHTFTITRGIYIAVKEVKQEQLISVYPSPATDRITITNTHTAIQQVEIFNMNGQLVSTTPVNGTSVEIPLMGAPAGVYLVKIKTANGMVTKRFSVE